MNNEFEMINSDLQLTAWFEEEEEEEEEDGKCGDEDGMVYDHDDEEWEYNDFCDEADLDLGGGEQCDTVHDCYHLSCPDVIHITLDCVDGNCVCVDRTTGEVVERNGNLGSEEPDFPEPGETTTWECDDAQCSAERLE